MRDGLGEQTIVITDPMDMVREVDVNMPMAVCAVALSRRGTPWAVKIHQFVTRNLLLRSGIGTVECLIEEADGCGLGRGLCRSSFIKELIERCGGNIHRVAKLATQSTALIAEQRDPDAVRGWPLDWAESRFYGGWGPWDAKWHLRQIGRCNIIFDNDEPPITRMVEEVRAAAAARARYAWLSGDESAAGWVRNGDDRNHLQLQLADIAAGWARTLIERGGYLAAAMRFRFVLYNGERLTLESADRLDKLRAAHRRLPRR